MIRKLRLIICSLLLTPTLFYSLTKEELQKIGNLIWFNEASKRIDLLVFWSEHELFPSLGIGHCIWFPKDLKAPYTQGFPPLCNYLQKHGVTLPAWLVKAKNSGAPWPSREEFLKDTKRIEELRHLLSSTINLQINFMIEQLERQLPLMVQAAPEQSRKRVKNIFTLMRSSALGTYALIDYLNFKGSGLNPKEESNGHRWGLLQVLLDMPKNVTVDNVNQAFSVSAAKILLQLIANSKPHYSRVKYLNGWIKRVSTYADPGILEKA